MAVTEQTVDLGSAEKSDPISDLPVPDWPRAGARPRGRRRWMGPYLAVAALWDAAGFLAAGLVSSKVRAVAPLNLPGGVQVPSGVWLIVTPLIWLACLASADTYDRGTAGTGPEEYRRVLSGALRFVALIAVVTFALKAGVGRSLVLLTVPLAVVLNTSSRKFLRTWLAHVRSGGQLRERVVVVGREAEAASFLEHLRSIPEAGFEVVGLFGGAPDPREDEFEVPALSDQRELFDFLQAGGADSVAVVDSQALGKGGLRALGWALEGLNVDIMVAPEATDVAGPRLRIRPVGGLPLVRVEEPRLSGPVRVLKELVERTVAALALVFLAPVLAVIALAVGMSSPGPTLFRQTRVGRHGRHFKILKFRTMYTDAEERQTELAELNECDGVLFKMRRDPRITPVGHLLRRFSLDELPQLWNVVAGQMSVVGPRPPLPSEVALYPAHVRRRLLVKPGLTGLWQVNGRSDLSWEDAVRLDLFYIDNWSVTGDLVIVARTIGAVLRGSGAY